MLDGRKIPAISETARARVDLFNIIDILAINETSTVGVQSCGQSFAEHKRKMLENEYTRSWLECVDRELFLIGWRKVKLKRGGKAMRWKPRIGIFEISGNEIVMNEKPKGEYENIQNS